MIKIALVWNSNSWKSTLLNTIAWTNRQTSNYHWTTVDIFSVKMKEKWKQFYITDLPWIYSLTPFTDEEAMTKTSLENDSYDLLVQVVDIKQKKRALSLTIELMKFNIPILLVFNKKINICTHNKLISEIKKKLWIQWIEIDVTKKHETKNLFFLELWKINKKLNYKKILESIYKKKMILGESFLKRVRFDFVKDTFEKHFPKNSLTKTLTEKIDKILLNKFLWIFFFLFLMWGIFEITFILWSYPMGWIDWAISSLQVFWKWMLWNWLFESFIVNWIIGWVGATLIFLAPILILFFLLNLLQDSGYTSRTAFLLDNLMSKFGLSWKSFTPLLMWFGCNVPAIMAIRTLWTFREKIITWMMIPFISCGARLPVYTVILAAFVKQEWRWTILFWLYVFWVLVSFLTGLLLNKFLKWKKRELLLEIPSYKIPNLKRAINFCFFKALMYLKKAAIFIFPLVVLSWTLFNFPQNVEIENSYWAEIWRIIQPVFEPLGFDWKISSALLAGLWAKEVVINIFSTLYSLDWEGSWLITALQKDPIFTNSTVASLLIFMLLYTPCFATIWALKQELWTKRAIVWTFYPLIVARFFAFLAHLIF